MLYTGLPDLSRIGEFKTPFLVNAPVFGSSVNVSIDIPVTLPNLFLIGLNAPVTTISPVVGC